MADQLITAALALSLVAGALLVLLLLTLALRELALGRSRSHERRASDPGDPTGQEKGSDALDPETVAVLAAAAAIALGRRVRLYRVHVHHDAAAEGWSRAGRAEIMHSHRLERKA
jgi:hypothetical protein